MHSHLKLMHREKKFINKQTEELHRWKREREQKTHTHTHLTEVPLRTIRRQKEPTDNKRWKKRIR